MREQVKRRVGCLARRRGVPFDGTLGTHPIDERSKKLSRAEIDSEQTNRVAVDNPGRHIPNIGDRAVYDLGRVRKFADLLTILVRPLTLHRRRVRVGRNVLGDEMGGFLKAAGRVLPASSLRWLARD
jgi:hypothetical protein